MGKQEFIVLITAGPPCPDFSRIRKSPKGADGESGWLFQHMIDIEYQLRLKFQGRPFETVIENVLPHNSLREHLLEMTEPLCMSPIVSDAADGGLVHRKRLWWTSIDWPDVETKLSRHTPWSTSWKTEDDWPRLHNPLAADLQAPLQHKGFSLPNCLQQNNKLFHCLTTPSQHLEGRPMPQTNRSRPASPSTTQRWQDDHHRYPPWQYEEQFLTQWPDGSFSTAPTELREQLQGLQVGYTEGLAGGDQTQRDVALGNAWHLPTAVWILFLVLLGTANAAVPRSPHESALDKVVNLWIATRVPFGPPPRRSGSEYMPQFSWTEHLDWALHRETNMTPKDLDPTLNWCLEHRRLFHPLIRFQHDVIEEIKDLVLEFEDHTMALVSYVTTTCTTRLQAQGIRNTDPYSHTPPTQITVPTDRGFISRVVGRLPTYGQADSRSKLARPPGSEVPPADPDGRLQTEEPRVHPQQARDQPCRRSLEAHAGRDLGRG